jgi:hypothetical protein
MLREYGVKYVYKFKRTIKQKNKVGAFCLGLATHWGFMLLCYPVAKLLWLSYWEVDITVLGHYN